MSERSKIAWQVTIAAAVNLIILVIIIAMSRTDAYAMGLGSGGERVSAVQKALKSKGYYSGEINGFYDFSTRRGIKKFQTDNGIEPSGNADFETCRALNITCENRFFSFESEILARYVQFVCGGKEYSEKLELCEKILAKKEDGQPLYVLLTDKEPEFYKKITVIEPDEESVRAACKAFLIRNSEL